MYSQFLSFLHTDTTKVVEILPRVRQGPTLIFKSSCSQYLSADDLATQGARISATIILT